MEKTARSSFYPAAGWVLAALWLLCLLPVILYQEMCFPAVFLSMGMRLVLTLALTIVNICFWRKKKWALWIVNGVMLMISALYLVLFSSLLMLKYGGPSEWKEAAGVGLSGIGMSRISEYDDHDNFLGDGTSMKVYSLSSREKGIARMQQGEGWRPLPLDENASRLAYGDEEHLPYLKDSQARTLAPKIQEGFWYFEDRQAQDEESKHSTDVFGRYSYNFTLAIYDANAERLYILKLDT